MFSLRPARFLATLATSALLLSSANGQDEERPLWEQEVMLLYSGTSTEFNRLRSLGKNNYRLARYTRALDTLHGKLEVEEGEMPYSVAERAFRSLVADRSDDAIGLASAYYLARIRQSNPYERDIAEAKVLYWDLYDEWPERFFGQMAFVKYATLELYDETSQDPVEERIQKLEAKLMDITFPELQQNAHRLFGEAYYSYELDGELALLHFEQAYEIGVPVESIRIEVLERIAELAEDQGKAERALLAYDELLLAAPRHDKAATFRDAAERLREEVNSAALGAP